MTTTYATFKSNTSLAEKVMVFQETGKVEAWQYLANYYQYAVHQLYSEAELHAVIHLHSRLEANKIFPGEECIVYGDDDLVEHIYPERTAMFPVAVGFHQNTSLYGKSMMFVGKSKLDVMQYMQRNYPQAFSSVVDASFEVDSTAKLVHPHEPCNVYLTGPSGETYLAATYPLKTKEEEKDFLVGLTLK